MRDLVESLQVMSESKGIHIHIHTDLAEQPRWLYPSMTKMVLGIFCAMPSITLKAHKLILFSKKQFDYCCNGIGISLPNDVKVQELSDSQLSLKLKVMALGCNWYRSFANN